MRLGLYGGSFNPVHCGHVRVAVEAREQLGLDEVRLMVAARPPHKQETRLPSFHLRFEMAKTAVRHVPGVEADDSEYRRPGLSYTAETLEICRSERPGVQLVFIMGSEAFAQLPSWHRYPELPLMAELAVVGRNRADLDRVGAEVARQWPGARAESLGAWRLPQGGLVRYLDAPLLEISGTDIRERWRTGRSLNCLVPHAVIALIRDNAAELGECWG